MTVEMSFFYWSIGEQQELVTVILLDQLYLHVHVNALQLYCHTASILLLLGTNLHVSSQTLRQCVATVLV